MSVTAYETFYLDRLPLRCAVCWDTGVVWRRESLANVFSRCRSCHAEGVDFSAPALRLAETLWQRLQKGQPVEPRAFVVARVLTHATAEQPAPSGALMEIAGVTSERTLKDTVRTLRREWLLPVGSSRGARGERPAGHYWMWSAADFINWSREFRRQAIDELVTLHRLQRQNFPELSGQDALDFKHDLQRQIEEALV